MTIQPIDHPFAHAHALGLRQTPGRKSRVSVAMMRGDKLIASDPGAVAKHGVGTRRAPGNVMGRAGFG
ncbi:hypothetical protein [Luteibacter sp.]|uniref:hypothetical protein n=1 Tax=Luteibacter sp. TaxID=1886636 RepID=UPI0025C0ED25|nr:hypothetical protein [Luteibacter sp.]